MASLLEAQGTFYPSSLCSVTVPTREGPDTVCGSSRGSGEVLDRVADLHTGPIQGPAQTQHSQQDDKSPGCIDTSISPCVLPCTKSKASGSDCQEQAKQKAADTSFSRISAPNRRHFPAVRTTCQGSISELCPQKCILAMSTDDSDTHWLWIWT